MYHVIKIGDQYFKTWFEKTSHQAEARRFTTERWPPDMVRELLGPDARFVKVNQRSDRVGVSTVASLLVNPDDVAPLSPDGRYMS